MHGTNKVAQVTLAFWVMKIIATTLGETAGDLLSMTLHVGYAESTVILMAVFVATLAAQVTVKTYHPFLYWSVILSTTTAGTTLSDFLDRTAGLGYLEGALLLAAILAGILALWRLTLGSVSVERITSPKVEIFYWAAILFSNTLGTALGDFLADSSGLGYEGGALVISGVLMLIAVAYFWSSLSHTLLFWLAFVLTRPLGATLGDLLTKPRASGGLDLGTLGSSAVLAVVLVGLILVSGRNRGGGKGCAEPSVERA